MAQKKHLFLGIAAVLALALTLTVAVREITVTDARTTDSTMSLTVSAGGVCAAGTCTVPLNGTFTLQASIDAAPAPEGYIGIQTEIDYQDLVDSGGNYKPAATGAFGTTELVWAPGTFPLRSPEPPTGTEGLVNHADATGLINPPETTATGPALELSMNCGGTNSTNIITIVPLDVTNTDASGFKFSQADGAISVPAKTTPLTVICGAAGATNTPVPPTATNTAEGPTNTPGPTDTPGPTPTATNTAPPTNTPVPSTATNTPGPTNTPAPATPTRTPTRTPTPGEELNGDANCDGTVNSVDALWILWDVADLSDLIPCPALADADKDGDIDSVDAALVLQFEAGKIGTLP